MAGTLVARVSQPAGDADKSQPSMAPPCCPQRQTPEGPVAPCTLSLTSSATRRSSAVPNCGGLTPSPGLCTCWSHVPAHSFPLGQADSSPHSGLGLTFSTLAIFHQTYFQWVSATGLSCPLADTGPVCWPPGLHSLLASETTSSLSSGTGSVLSLRPRPGEYLQMCVA